MKFLITIKSCLLLLVIVLISSVGLAGHTSAMSTMPHGMGSMNHSSSDSTSCATLCRTAVINTYTNNVVRSDEENDDDESTSPFYVANQVGQINEKLVKQRHFADAIKPPPKIPVYILYGVFRV